MALGVNELGDALRSAGKAFLVALDEGSASREQVQDWLYQAEDAIVTAVTASDARDRDQAVKELRDFEDAFSLKFGTMELRGAEAARQALFEAGKKLIPILVKAIVALLG